MASILKVDDLRGNTAAGNITITSEGGSATMQLQQGVAKAWVNFDASSGTPTERDSLNVSSLTDNGTGVFSPNFSSNMSSTGYSSQGATNAYSSRTTYAGYGGSTSQFNITTSSFSMVCVSHYHNSVRDGTEISSSIHGDLA